jgi:histidine triad (HIT) family protein
VSIFNKIINREIPAKIVFEDEQCLAFRDVNPQAPTHILLIPKREIPSMNEVTDADASLMGHLMAVVPKIAKAEGISEKGYRVVINTNAHAGQTVPHVHLHILGGRAMQWPPG